MQTFFVDKKIIFVFVVFALALSPLTVFGEPTFGPNDPPTRGTIEPPTTSGSNSYVRLQNPLGNIEGFCGFIKQLFLSAGALGVPIAVLFLVYAGFLFVWARGRPDALTKAKNNLFYTLFGIAIFFAAWMLALAIAATLAQFGVNIAGDCR